MNIVLSGMPACGKTSVARELGKLLGAEVLDTDAEIVKAHGNIPRIFEVYGEEYFRALETETVKAVSKRNNAVISIGGGSLLKEENIALLKQNGKIVYLRTQLKTLLSRVSGDTSRPLLACAAEEKLKKLFSERKNIYEGTADFVIDTDCLTPEKIAKSIKKIYVKT